MRPQLDMSRFIDSIRKFQDEREGAVLLRGIRFGVRGGGQQIVLRGTDSGRYLGGVRRG